MVGLKSENDPVNFWTGQVNGEGAGMGSGNGNQNAPDGYGYKTIGPFYTVSFFLSQDGFGDGDEGNGDLSGNGFGTGLWEGTPDGFEEGDCGIGAGAYLYDETGEGFGAPDLQNLQEIFERKDKNGKRCSPWV